MPKSLIILENHLDTSAYQFLFDNAERLRDLGYTQMLFELYDQHEPSLYMKQLREQLPFIQKSAMSQAAERIIKVYDKFCALDLMCRFIDPESENVAINYNKRLQKAYLSGDSQEFKFVEQQRIEATKQRDTIMARSILEANQSSRAKGGIIFVGGFLHNNLIKQLEISARQTEDPFRYVIFHGKTLYRDDTIDANKSQWKDVGNASYRANFYGTDSVKHIDPSQYTFEMIKATLHLSSSKPCIEGHPSIASHFNQISNVPFQFSVDECSIVSASLEVEDSEKLEIVVEKIKNCFPGLYFFNQRTQRTNKLELTIPGLNLPDQRAVIEQIFSSK